MEAERKTIAIVAPAYNEEQVIGQFHAELSRVLDMLDSRYNSKIIFVLDRSSDRSEEILTGIASNDPRTELIVMSARFGHQAALRAGISKALGADAIIMMDSDLQHPPSLIPTLLERYEAGSDVVYTVRRSSADVSVPRRLIGKLFYRTLHWLSESPVHANAADFRLISSKVAEVLEKDFAERSLYLRGLIPLIGFQQEGVEFQSAERAAGRSHYTFKQSARLAIAAITSTSARPLRIGVWLAFYCGLAAVLLMFYHVGAYLIERNIPSGFTTIVLLLLFIASLQFFALGIIGLYIGKIFEQVKSRPAYIIDKEIS
jgi:polyisoprenyl-phosphate glycosyltransferase